MIFLSLVTSTGEISTKAFGKSIVQPGTKGGCIASVTLDLEIEKEKVVSVNHEPMLHYVDEDTPLHPKVVGRIEDFHALTEKWLDEPIGTTKGNMLFRCVFSSCT